MWLRLMRLGVPVSHVLLLLRRLRLRVSHGLVLPRRLDESHVYMLEFRPLIGILFHKGHNLRLKLNNTLIHGLEFGVVHLVPSSWIKTIEHALEAHNETLCRKHLGFLLSFSAEFFRCWFRKRFNVADREDSNAAPDCTGVPLIVHSINDLDHIVLFKREFALLVGYKRVDCTYSRSCRAGRHRWWSRFTSRERTLLLLI